VVGLRRGRKCIRRESNGWGQVVKMRKGGKRETIKK
jgi:hypothetical protein